MVRSKIFKSVSGVFSGNIFHKVIERSMRSLHDKYFKEIRTFCLYVFHQDGQPLRNYTNTIADNKTQHCHWKSINIQHKTLLAKRKCKIRFLHNMKEYCSYLYIFQMQKVTSPTRSTNLVLSHSTAKVTSFKSQQHHSVSDKN